MQNYGDLRTPRNAIHSGIPFCSIIEFPSQFSVPTETI